MGEAKTYEVAVYEQDYHARHFLPGGLLIRTRIEQGQVPNVNGSMSIEGKTYKVVHRLVKSDPNDVGYDVILGAVAVAE